MGTRRDMFEPLKRGHQEAWQAFDGQYRPWLLAHARNDLRRPADAEDVCQIVLAKVAKAMPRFEYDPKEGRFRGWLLTILKHEVINFLRRQDLLLIEDLKPPPQPTRRTSRTARLGPEPSDHPPSDLERRQLEEVIDQTLAQLRAKVSAEAFEMFYRHFFLGDSAEEFAREFGRTLNAVYTSTSKTLRQFRVLFRRNFDA
jgi:RNA polymerase sigma factor (sigma-70 family)